MKPKNRIALLGEKINQNDIDNLVINLNLYGKQKTKRKVNVNKLKEI
jgi:hypothetical protein